MVQFAIMWGELTCKGDEVIQPAPEVLYIIAAFFLLSHAPLPGRCFALNHRTRDLMFFQHACDLCHSSVPLEANRGSQKPDGGVF